MKRDRFLFIRQGQQFAIACFGWAGGGLTPKSPKSYLPLGVRDIRHNA